MIPQLITPIRSRIAVLGALMLGPVFAAIPDPAPIPDYEMRRAAHAPTIDVDLSDPAWSKATVITLGFPWAEQTGPRNATRVRLLWDDQNIYGAFECDDDVIVTRETERDAPTYKDDAVEVFFNPFPNRTEYVGLEINAAGVLYDYLFVHPQKLYPNYDLKDVKLAASRAKAAGQAEAKNKCWTVEFAIPIANFVDQWDQAPVRAGTMWRVNFARWDGSEPSRRLSVWSDPKRDTPNPHAPARFGQLRFVDSE